MYRHLSLRAFALIATLVLTGLAKVASAQDAPETPAVETAAVLKAAPPLVYVIPVKDMIERGLLYAFRRGMEEAAKAGATAVVLDMDTPGGKLDAAEEIVLLLLNAPMPTYTFVNPRAISAGAIISFATDGIYMTPHALIGDAMPIMMSPLPMGGAQAVPDDLKEKVMSPTIALARSAAQAKGHDAQIAEAMIRPEMEYKIGDRMICPEGQLLTLTSQEAIEPLREGGKPLLAAGTVATLDEMLQALNLGNARVVTVSVTTAERIARVIEGFPMSGILLALGLLGVYLEIKTPGFGVLGIMGVCLLALWFWGHHIAGLSGLLELLLFSVGVILILAEVFLIPGFGITGLAGIICLVAGILLSMVGQAPSTPADLPTVTFPALQWRNGVYNAGMAMLLTFAAGLVLARFLPNTPLFRHLILGTKLDSAAGYQSSPATVAASLVGQRGVAVTTLHPAGLGDFGGTRRDVVSRGPYLAAGTPIVIAEAHGNRVVVEAVPTPSA